MSSRLKAPRHAFRLAVAGVALAASLSACGFEPVYGRRTTGSGGGVGAASGDLALVAVDTIPERSGQLLRNFLIDRFDVGRKRPTPRYKLIVQLQESRSSIGYLPNTTTTATRLDITGTYRLVEIVSGATVARGDLTASDSYNQLEGGFTSVVNEAGARERAIQVMADGLVIRIGLFLRDARV
jgi:LPS-assembly lipoprotein